jgi:hypothetical protein
MIPITAGDIDKSSYIMDAMAYHGRQIILPAYYDVCLKRKYARDEESESMLDIIFTSTVYDIGSIFGIGGFSVAIQSNVVTGENKIASTYEQLAGKIEKDLQNLIDQFEANR